MRALTLGIKGRIYWPLLTTIYFLSSTLQGFREVLKGQIADTKMGPFELQGLHMCRHRVQETPFRMLGIVVQKGVDFR